MHSLKISKIKPLLEIGESSTHVLKRFRHHINPMRPKMPTWKRKIMLTLAEPKIPEKYPTTQFQWQDCQKKEEDKTTGIDNTPNAYEALYVKEMLELFETSKMVGIYHFNAIENRAYRKAWQNGRRLKMELKTYEHKMVKGGLEGTVWENLTFFLSGCNDYGHNSGLRMTFCKDVLADKLLQYEKKVPEAFLIAAVVENRILDRGEVDKLAKMPPIESILGETVAILNSPAQKTLGLLNSSQQALSTNLSQYIKDQSPPEES